MLQDQVRRRQKASGRPWIMIDPLDILLESAIVQFELLTAYQAPRELMQQALLDSNSSSITQSKDLDVEEV